ncbi:unnamed protein product [Callosobruchus maculatus]|uniref:Secreted protein n=1 Tax=Callosobruchus maculatus TaxID=64391 RepID=A0A653DDW0_CALMS|nr:unnamed protein product [Callosobruchus maculatus]
MTKACCKVLLLLYITVHIFITKQLLQKSQKHHTHHEVHLRSCFGFDRGVSCYFHPSERRSRIKWWCNSCWWCERQKVRRSAYRGGQRCFQRGQTGQRTHRRRKGEKNRDHREHRKGGWSKGRRRKRNSCQRSRPVCRRSIRKVCRKSSCRRWLQKRSCRSSWDRET